MRRAHCVRSVCQHLRGCHRWNALAPREGINAFVTTRSQNHLYHRHQDISTRHSNLFQGKYGTRHVNILTTRNNRRVHPITRIFHNFFIVLEPLEDGLIREEDMSPVQNKDEIACVALQKSLTIHFLVF